MKKGIAVVFGISLAVFMYLFLSGYSSCAKSRLEPMGETGKTIMTTCTVCHDTQRICDALGKKDRDAWSMTVTRMVGKGASLDKEGIPQVVGFLSGLNPGSKPVCK
jgi:hypothetical protein